MGAEDSSLQRTEKEAIVWRMARGGHLSPAGETWWIRISSLGKRKSLPEEEEETCFTSSSPKRSSPWYTTDF